MLEPASALGPARLEAVDSEGDDAAAYSPFVVYLDPAGGLELAAEDVGEALDIRPRAVDAEIECVVDGRAETELGGVVRLPVLEPLGVGSDLVRVGARPRGGVEVEERRLDRAQVPGR